MSKQTKENDLKLNRAEAPEDGKTVWRCVHDGKQVITTFETNGQSESIHEILDFDTEDELEAGIKALGLDNSNAHGIDSRTDYHSRRRQLRRDQARRNRRDGDHPTPQD